MARKLSYISQAKQKYLVQRWDAINRRGIEFNLTFEQWWDIWQQSGKYEERGRLGHQYVMARFNDTGPYQIGNVKIITHDQNLNETKGMKRPPRTKEHEEKLRLSRIGRPSHWKGKPVPQSRIDKYKETCRLRKLKNEQKETI